MKLSFVLGAAVVGVALGGWAQDIKPAQPPKPHVSKEFEVKEGASGKSAGSAAGPSAAPSTTSKDLRHIEAERSKRVAKTNRVSVPKVQDRQKSTKINFAAKPTAKASASAKTPDPYQGRLKQKGSHH
jgi:hypothetical protein